jgi:hypothetical protein
MSSLPPSVNKSHRTLAKSTPFSSGGGGEAGISSRSSRRRIMASDSLRKQVRKSNAIARRRRHMTIRDVVGDGGGGVSSSTTTTGHMDESITSSVPATIMTNSNNQHQVDNPYDLESRRVRETIDVASSIVHAVASVGESSEQQVALLDELVERLCLLVTPTNDPIATCILSNSILSHSIQLQPCYEQQGSDESSSSPIVVNLAVALVEALSKIISSRTTVRIKAVIIVNQLAATEPPLVTNYNTGQVYYSSPSSLLASIPASWCAALVGSNALLSALLQLLPPSNGLLLPNSDDEEGYHQTQGELELCEKSTWAIGNMASDSEMARILLIDKNILHSLSDCIIMGLSILRREKEFRPITTTSSSLLRSAIWAMTNVIYGGRIGLSGTSSSSSSSIPNSTTTTSTTCSFRYVDRVWALNNIPLTREDATLLLTCTCTELVNETCLLLLSLTIDYSMINYYLDDDVLVRALIERLARATDALCHRLGGVAAASAEGSIMLDNDNNVAGCLVSLCRIIKNAANAYYDGGYTLKNIDSMDRYCHLIGSSLARLISLGTIGAGGNANTVAYEAASTIGACLTHVYISDGTTNPFLLACEATLRPALCGALINELSTFDLRREVVWALWNMVNHHKSEDDEVYGTEQISRLVGIMSFSPRDMARSLTSLLTTMDMDAMEASLCLIDAALRRIPRYDDGSGTTPTIFEEVGLVDALWRVCDCDSDESFIAEMAAGILDDFYEEREDSHIDNDDDVMLEPSSVGGQFQFQLPHDNNIPVNGYNFSDVNGVGVNPHPSLGGSNNIPPGGRGRGRVVPAWMATNSII